jgi:hypothetical protein
MADVEAFGAYITVERDLDHRRRLDVAGPRS